MKITVKIIQVRRPLAMNYGKNAPTNQLLIRFLGLDEKNFFDQLKFLAVSIIILSASSVGVTPLWQKIGVEIFSLKEIGFAHGS
jgi:hypothetical protein